MFKGFVEQVFLQRQFLQAPVVGHAGFDQPLGNFNVAGKMDSNFVTAGKVDVGNTFYLEKSLAVGWISQSEQQGLWLQVIIKGMHAVVKNNLTRLDHDNILTEKMDFG